MRQRWRPSELATSGCDNGEEIGAGAEVLPLRDSPNFGAEIVGLDIRECLRRGWAQGHEDGGAEYLDALVVTHGLLLFRSQLPRLTAEELVAFSKWFGSGQLHSARALVLCAIKRCVACQCTPCTRCHSRAQACPP